MKKIIYTLLIIYIFLGAVKADNITYSDPQINGNPIGWGSWQSFNRQDVAIAYCDEIGETYVSHINDGITGPNGLYSHRNYNNTLWENNTWKSDGYTNVICDDGNNTNTTGTGGTGGTTGSEGDTYVSVYNEVQGSGKNVLTQEFLDDYYPFRNAIFFIFGMFAFIMRIIPFNGNY